MGTVVDGLEIIGALLKQLDRRRHTTPARLEVSQEEGRWTAMILADNLTRPMCASGHSPAAAVQELAATILAVKRRRSA